MQAASEDNPMDNVLSETSPSSSRAAQPTIGGSVYVKPQDIAWSPTQFAGISIKVLYEDKAKGELTLPAQMGAGRDPADAQASRDRADLRRRGLVLRP